MDVKDYTDDVLLKTYGLFITQEDYQRAEKIRLEIIRRGLEVSVDFDGESVEITHIPDGDILIDFKWDDDMED